MIKKEKNIEENEIDDHYSNKYIHRPLWDEDQEIDDARRFRETISDDNRPY